MQVRYDLLDCNHAFLDSVLKLISLMEMGVVKGGETIVPHLFQFLVLLAYDNSKLMSIPEVCRAGTQWCRTHYLQHFGFVLQINYNNVLLE